MSPRSSSSRQLPQEASIEFLLAVFIIVFIIIAAVYFETKSWTSSPVDKTLTDEQKSAVLMQLSSQSTVPPMSDSDKSKTLKTLSASTSAKTAPPLTQEEKVRILQSMH